MNETGSYAATRELVLSELHTALNSIDSAQVEQLIDAVLAADQVFFVGVGRVLLSLQAIAKRLDEPQLEELRMAFQRQADKTWGLEPQLKGLEERDFGQRDGAFLI